MPRSSASKKSVVAGERDRPDVARRRAQWTKYQDRVEPERLVFIDETWTKTNMAPLRGWAPRGAASHRQGPAWPLEDHDVPGRPAHRPDRCAMAHRGPDRRRELSNLRREGSSCRRLRPGDIVIMDNLGSHKGKVVRQLIRSAGAKLFFLPKYSPDLNPIEQVFAKLKHLLRKAAARTVDAVCAAIGAVLQAFTPQECANYFRNSGYANLMSSRF